MPEAKARLREAHDRLSTSDYLVGFFYFRNRWYPGAIDRFYTILKEDAAYTRWAATMLALVPLAVTGGGGSKASLRHCTSTREGAQGPRASRPAVVGTRHTVSVRPG